LYLLLCLYFPFRADLLLTPSCGGIGFSVRQSFPYMKKSHQRKVLTICLWFSRLGLPRGLQLFVLDHVKWQDVTSHIADRYVVPSQG